MGNSQSDDKLKQKEIDKLKNSTEFSGHEIREWHAKFHEDYPNGFISREEFISMYKQLFPNGDATRFAHRIFEAYDADGNGVISFTEFLTTMSVSARGTIDEKLDWSFNLYDTNGDGTISRKEAVDIIWAIYKAKGEGSRATAEDSAFKIFIAMDKNKDDRLSRAEFIHGIKSSKSLMQMLCAGMDTSE